MASAGQWEVVGKPKKGKGQPQSMTKSQKKTFIDRMPRIDTRDPVKEDRTIYDAFNAGEGGNAASAAAGEAPRQRGSQAASSQPPARKKKPEQNGRREVGNKVLGLDAALAQLKQAEMESVVSQSQLRFPDNQDVWLKDLASFINLRLDVADNDPIFKDKPKDYPQSQVSAACRQTINTLLSKCATQSLEHLFYHCIQSMLSESAKGLSTVGYRLFLQMLAFYHSSIVLPKLQQYLELIKTSVNRPSQCLSILWAVGQCGVVDLGAGLRVWLDLMLPCLGVRSVAAYPVEYLENLFLWHPQRQGAYGEVGLREYFHLLDTTFSPSLTLHPDLRKRLHNVYPEVKNIAYGANPSTNLRNFFASYLRRAEPNCSPAMKQEVLLCLVLCLSTDKHSWSTWCQMYTKHLPQSGVLLQHLLENWELLSKGERRMLRETLRSFSVTNEELIGQGGASKEGFAICDAATKELLQRMSKGGFPWGVLVFFVLSLLSAIVAYDVLASPSYKECRTVRFLEDYGVLGVLEQAWGRVTTFLSLTISWTQKNVPQYYRLLKEWVGPRLQGAWLAVKDATFYLADVLHPHWLWVSATSQQGWLWVYERCPEAWDQCGVWLRSGWVFTQDYTLWIWKHVLHWCIAAQHWLHQYAIPSVATGNLSTAGLQESAWWGVRRMQNFTLSWVTWCQHLLSSADA